MRTTIVHQQNGKMQDRGRQLLQAHFGVGPNHLKHDILKKLTKKQDWRLGDITSELDEVYEESLASNNLDADLSPEQIQKWLEDLKKSEKIVKSRLNRYLGEDKIREVYAREQQNLDETMIERAKALNDKILDLYVRPKQKRKAMQILQKEPKLAEEIVRAVQEEEARKAEEARREATPKFETEYEFETDAKKYNLYSELVSIMEKVLSESGGWVLDELFDERMNDTYTTEELETFTIPSFHFIYLIEVWNRVMQGSPLKLKKNLNAFLYWKLSNSVGEEGNDIPYLLFFNRRRNKINNSLQKMNKLNGMKNLIYKSPAAGTPSLMWALTHPEDYEFRKDGFPVQYRIVYGSSNPAYKQLYEIGRCLFLYLETIYNFNMNRLEAALKEVMAAFHNLSDIRSNRVGLIVKYMKDIFKGSEDLIEYVDFNESDTKIIKFLNRFKDLSMSFKTALDRASDVTYGQLFNVKIDIQLLLQDIDATPSELQDNISTNDIFDGDCTLVMESLVDRKGGVLGDQGDDGGAAE